MRINPQCSLGAHSRFCHCKFNNSNWTDNSTDETKFEVYSASSANGTYTLAGEVAANTTQFTHSGLLAGTTYYYKVRAVGSEAASNFSESLETKTGGITAPTLTSLSSPDNQTITINWQDNDATETGSKLSALEANANFTEIGAVGANVTTYSDNTVQFGTTYYYRVYAVNSTEQSNRSNVYTLLRVRSMSNTRLRVAIILFSTQGIARKLFHKRIAP
jgi:predicted phage tail protein